LLGKKATQILVEDGKACGVVFEDSFSSGSGKTEVYADRIIANAAVPLVVDMLPEKEATKLAGRIDNLENACALISVYIGFNKAPKELGSHHYSTILAGDDVKTLADLRANSHGPWENRNLIFVDYSQVDSRLAPEGKAVGVICAVDYLADWNTLDEYSYATKKEEVACILLSRLEKLLPGIGEQIEHYDVGTSRTIQHYTLNPDGTPYGFAQTPAQSGMGRVPSKSPTENLYFAGAWTFPGAGFTGAIISGFLCGEAVTGTLPNTTKGSPERLPDERIVQLVEKREIATATIELAFEKPPGFVYKAGQYAVLELMNPRYQELDMPIRPLSMASHPDEEVVRFTMRLSDSSFKKSVHALELGGKCRLFGPMGSFSVAGNGRGIVFLISGIGITPVLPFLKELEKSGISQPVYLFYSNRTEAAAAYHRELKAVAMPTFKYIPVFTGSQARIDSPFLEDELGSFAEFDYYLVGTHGFLDSMQSLLRANNVNEAQIYADDYG
jgi:all-trans-retinol 13,14-reductase